MRELSGRDCAGPGVALKRMCCIVLAALAAVAAPAATNSAPATLKFSGYDWIVRSPGKGGPGPNQWSASNVWVDAVGRMHLKISQRQGTWYCAEVYTQQRLGFGRYQWWVTGRVDNLDPNVVLGLFNYPPEDVGPDGTNEIDIEIARWRRADAPNGNFSVYPARNKLTGHHQRFEITYRGSNTTHRFNWQHESVFFQCLAEHCSGDGDEIGRWIYQPAEYRDYIPQQPMPVRMNLWLSKGVAPSDGREVEIVIASFVFKP